MKLDARVDDLETGSPDDDAVLVAYRDGLRAMARLSGNGMQVLHETLRPVPDLMTRAELLYRAWLRFQSAPANWKIPNKPRGMVHGCDLDDATLHHLYPPQWFARNGLNALDHIRGHEERNHHGHPVPWGRDGVVLDVAADTGADVEAQARIRAERDRQRYLASLRDEVRDYLMRRRPFE